MDSDGEISVTDVQKFLQSYSSDKSLCNDVGALNTMIQQTIAEYRPDGALKSEDTPAEWFSGPRALSYAHFAAMLNEVNDSIKQPGEGKNGDIRESGNFNQNSNESGHP